MHIRKVTQEGRVNIPVELLSKYGLKVHDEVIIDDDNERIYIKKMDNNFVCSITNKVFQNPLMVKIGEATISEEGLNLIKEYISYNNNNE